jgi:hypothetical protein
MKSIRNLKPFFFENSKLPYFLEKFAPIKINAISLFGFVFSKGEMNEATKRHEAIHFQQQLETLMVGFLFIYLFDYVVNLWIKKMPGSEAYMNLRAEKEAYAKHFDEEYLPKTRKRWAWLYEDFENPYIYQDSTEDDNA